VIDAVIFDLDGTLVDIPIDYEKLFDDFKRIMVTDNVRPLAAVVSGADRSTRKSLFKTWDKAELTALGKVSARETGLRIYRENAKKRKALAFNLAATCCRRGRAGGRQYFRIHAK